MDVSLSLFGLRKDGREVHRIVLDNGRLTAAILTHGAVLQSLHLSGHDHSLTLGATDLAAYEGKMAYFGAIVAPVVNRIAGASARVGDITHRFEANEWTNTLHSGAAGSQNALWSIEARDGDRVTLTLLQPDAEGGFPGARSIRATYRLDGDTLRLDLEATTTALTLMNIAHHGYWNLDGTQTWKDHEMRIDADRILPIDGEKIPTGEIVPLDGHPLDFRTPQRLVPGSLPFVDHNFCLSDARRALAPAVRLIGRDGIAMQVATTEPGVQIFDGGPIDTGELPTVHGRPYRAHCGLAIEPQGWPDAPNREAFPSIALSPGDTYRQTTTFRFTD